MEDLIIRKSKLTKTSVKIEDFFNYKPVLNKKEEEDNFSAICYSPFHIKTPNNASPETVIPRSTRLFEITTSPEKTQKSPSKKTKEETSTKNDKFLTSQFQKSTIRSELIKYFKINSKKKNELFLIKRSISLDNEITPKQKHPLTFKKKKKTSLKLKTKKIRKNRILLHMQKVKMSKTLLRMLPKRRRMLQSLQMPKLPQHASPRIASKISDPRNARNKPNGVQKKI